MTFRAKLTLCVTLLLALSFCLGGNLLMAASYSSALGRERDNALFSFELTRYTVSSAGSALNTESMVEVLRAIRTPQNTALLLTQQGLELFSTGGGDRFDRRLLEACTETELAVSESVSADGARQLQISGALPGEGGFVLSGLYPMSEATQALHEQQRIYRLTFVITLALGFVLTLFMMRWLVRPLRALSRSARRIANGDLAFRADESGGDEFARLARDFNRMADELSRRMEEIERAVQRQEAFTGAFAHEMKTPMTSIIGYSDLIRSQSLSPEERDMAANYIYSEARRLEKLSGKLLELLVLRRRDFPLRPCSIASLVRATVAELAFYRKKYGVTFSCSVQEGVRRAEHDLLKTLLVNLIDNGRKAMTDGGEIAIVQRLTPEGFTLSVTDHGCGMAPEELSKITDAFYRVDKSRSLALGGAGLGLSICSEIAAIHGGTLHFDSAPGRGTTVTMTAEGGEEA